MHKLIMDKVRLCVSLELRTGNLAIVVWRRLSAWSGEWRVGGEKLLIQFHTQTINSTQALAINRPSLGGDVNTRPEQQRLKLLRYVRPPRAFISWLRMVI